LSYKSYGILNNVLYQVGDMIAQGVVKVSRTKPTCVSPLGLVTKEAEGKVKHRLVFDASRWVNKFVKDQHVTLSHLNKALEMTEYNDWQVPLLMLLGLEPRMIVMLF
jgi:hypothetical protein